MSARDDRTKRQKLEAMANQTASPHEAEVAKRKLAEHDKAHPIFKRRSGSRGPGFCVNCGEAESSSPSWKGMHKYGPTDHDFETADTDGMDFSPMPLLTTLIQRVNS